VNRFLLPVNFPTVELAEVSVRRGEGTILAESYHTLNNFSARFETIASRFKNGRMLQSCRRGCFIVKSS
jgi:hypothetical protein